MLAVALQILAILAVMAIVAIPIKSQIVQAGSTASEAGPWVGQAFL
jgi:Tfp pilus assembly protein FimT